MFLGRFAIFFLVSLVDALFLELKFNIPDFKIDHPDKNNLQQLQNEIFGHLVDRNVDVQPWPGFVELISIVFMPRGLPIGLSIKIFLTPNLRVALVQHISLLVKDISKI
jgi:hypothetical protein